MHEIANWKHLEVKRIRMGGNRLAKPKSTFDRVKSISNELTILFNYIHPYLNEICINYELKLQCCYFDVWVSFCAFYYHISIYRGLRVFRYEIVWNRSERDYQRWVPFIMNSSSNVVILTYVWVFFCAFYYYISIYKGLGLFRYEIEVREIIKGGFLLFVHTLNF